MKIWNFISCFVLGVSLAACGTRSSSEFLAPARSGIVPPKSITNTDPAELLVTERDIVDRTFHFLTIAAYGDSESLTVSGNAASINAMGLADSVSLAGQSDTLTIGSGTIALAAGATASANGVGNRITLSGSDRFTFNGGDNSYTLSGGNNTLTENGTNNAITDSSNSDSLTVNGAGNAILMSGTGGVVQTGNGTISLANNAQVTINGVDDQINVAANDTLTFAGSSSTGTVSGANSNFTVNGLSDSLQISGSSDTLTINGGSNSATLTGTSELLTANGNDNSDGQHRLCRRLEQDVLGHRLVLVDDGVQWFGDREDTVEVRHRQQLGLVLRQPRRSRHRLAFRAMAVAARVVAHAREAAVVAAVDMTAQRRRPALLNSRHDLHLRAAQMTGVGMTMLWAKAAEHIRHFEQGA